MVLDLLDAKVVAQLAMILVATQVLRDERLQMNWQGARLACHLRNDNVRLLLIATLLRRVHAELSGRLVSAGHVRLVSL